MRIELRLFVLLAILPLCLCASAQHTLSTALHATTQAIEVAPQRPIDPGRPDTTIVPVDIREDYMPDPSAPSGDVTPAGTIPYDIVRPNNGRVNLNIPIESFASEFEASHGISLTYQGGLRTNVMGRGWSLSGISVISRCGRDFFTDANTSPISLEDNETWSLDGTRLIFQGLTDGVRKYRTQIGNIMATQDADGIFTVFYPDGSKSYYGEKDSLHHYVTSHATLDGKVVNYDYTNSHYGYRLLTSVRYGEGRNLDFHYMKTYASMEPDCKPKYIGGVAVEPRHRLDSIYVKKDGKLLATYVIEYPMNMQPETQPHMICRLDSSGQRRLKPLKFAYHGNAEKKFKKRNKKLGQMLQIEDYDMSKLIVCHGRFDPASEDDCFMIFANRQSYNHVIDGVYSSHYESCYSTADKIILTTDMHHNGYDIPCAVVETDTCFVEALAMDVDGCAGDELVRVNNHVQGNQDVTVFTVMGNFSTSMQPLFSRTLSMPALSINGQHSVRPKAFLPGDFDGDGRADLLVLSYSNPTPVHTSGRIDLMDLMTGVCKGTYSVDSCEVQNFSWDDPMVENEMKWWWFNHSDRILVLDHDGDKKKELGVVNEHGLFLYSFSFGPSGNVAMQRKQADCPVTLSDFEYLDIIPCDLNGDGNTDLTTARKRPAVGNGDIRTITMTSDGAGKFMTSVSQASSGEYDGQVALTDFNRDGCTDIFTNDDHGNTALGLSANRYLIGGNVIDGRLASLAALDPTGGVTLYQYDSPSDVAHTLAALSDGSGKELVFTHGRLFLNHDTSFSPQHFDYPLSAVYEGMLVNTREQLRVGTDSVSDTHFRYTYPVVHLQGLGFLGFESVERTDAVTGKAALEVYSPENLGMLCHSESDRSEKDYTLDKHIASDKHISVAVSLNATKDLATGITTSTAYTYDGFGNVLTATTAYPGGITRTATNEYHNVDADGIWLVGLERRHTESVTRGGETVTEGRLAHYNPSWLPDTVVDWRGCEQRPVSTRVVRYDNKRRPDRIRTRAFDGDWLTRHIAYDGDSRLPQFVSDERGIHTSMVHGDYGLAMTCESPELICWLDDDPVGPVIEPAIPHGGDSPNGGAGTVIDPPGPLVQPVRETRFHYDTFGRPDSVTAPDGSVRAVTQSWTGDVPGAICMSEVTETGRPALRTWIDALGRKVRQATQRFDGTWAYTLFEYDSRGRLQRESEPTVEGSPGGWTTYTYDSFDRLLLRQHPDGHADTYSYDGLSTTSTVDGVTSTRTVDALGNLVEVEDAGGTLRYTLRADGMPAAIHAPGGISTTFDYDDYGRRTAIHDPSAGTRATAYDNNGHVAAETDACGRAVTSVHDANGLLTGRVFDGGQSMSLSYNKWGQPTLMTGSDGHSKAWTYNSQGQLTSESVDGFRKTFSYDKNVVTTVAYSKDNSYICSENYSHMNGHLTSITLGTGDTLWTLDGQDAWMRPTVEGLGGRLTRTLAYDRRGNVTDRLVTDDGDNEVQWSEWRHDAGTGNPELRVDWTRNCTEAMDYDDLNRLTEVTLQTPSHGLRYCPTVYDGKGNILSQGDAGQLGYGTTRPYAFSELLSPSTIVPQREQHIAFNAMQRADTISEGGYTAAFSYCGDMSRATMTVTDSLGGSETRTYYNQQYNEFTRSAGGTMQTRRVLWLGGTPYDAPAALLQDYGEDGWRLVHVLRDNLGSITHVVDTAGTVLQELSYTAWGLLRDPATLEPYAPDAQPDLLLGRGFTGHEHLPWFGLVNMNARLYDPAVGRFLSPDPFIQSPDNTQSYNRYSYCLNNPLRYVDENGMNLYYLNPWLGWQYQQYAQSEDIGVTLPGIVVYGGQSTWSKWSSYIDAPFTYNSWQGGALGYNDWRENRFGAPVSYYSYDYQCSGGGYSRSQQTSSDAYRTLGYASITINALSGLPTVVETTWDNVVKKNLDMPFLKKVKPTDYAEAFKTVDPITKEMKSAVDMAKAASFVKTAGKCFVVADAAVTGLTALEDIRTHKYASATARVVVTGVTIGIALVPGVGPVIAFGIGMADALWGQQFYDYVQDIYDKR